MRVVSRQEVIVMEFDSKSEYDEEYRELKNDGWILLESSCCGDVLVGKFKKMYRVELPTTVREAIERYGCSEVLISIGGRMMFSGGAENFIMGIPDSLHYSRLSKRRVKSVKEEQGVLHIEVSQESGV